MRSPLALRKRRPPPREVDPLAVLSEEERAATARLAPSPQGEQGGRKEGKGRGGSAGGAV